MFCSHPTVCLLVCLLVRRAISSREFWTTNPTLMQQLAQGSEECLARSNLRCPRTNPPFHYSVRITGGWEAAVQGGVIASSDLGRCLPTRTAA